MTELVTSRLRVRPWSDSDREPFAALNADPEVVEFLRAPLTREESDAFIDRVTDHIAEHGFGFWATETLDGEFLGFVGLAIPSFEAHFTPCVEIGWRLARPAWGHGYATEAARACLAFAWDEVGADEVVSFTATTNRRSMAVMERIGMTRDPADDFDHPRVPEGNPLRRHVLYRIPRPTS